MKIVIHSAKKLGVVINKDSAEEIARRSRGTPRIANRLLRRIRDYAQVKNIGIVDLAIVSQSLKDMGIDEGGLDEIDRKVLKVILENYNGGPVGVEALAASLNEEVDTIVDTIEPYLLKMGYIKRTSRGRVATKLAYKHFGLPYNRESAEDLFGKNKN